jgi:hypothetical protein
MRKLILKIIYKLLHKIPEDVDDDGKVSVLDLVKVQKYILNKKDKGDDK